MAPASPAISSESDDRGASTHHDVVQGFVGSGRTVRIVTAAMGKLPFQVNHKLQ
jgi:hypothetical protein